MSLFQSCFLIHQKNPALVETGSKKPEAAPAKKKAKNEHLWHLGEKRYLKVHLHKGAVCLF